MYKAACTIQQRNLKTQLFSLGQAYRPQWCSSWRHFRRRLCCAIVVRTENVFSENEAFRNRYGRVLLKHKWIVIVAFSKYIRTVWTESVLRVKHSFLNSFSLLWTGPWSIFIVSIAHGTSHANGLTTLRKINKETSKVSFNCDALERW